MADITPLVNDLLKSHGAPPIPRREERRGISTKAEGGSEGEKQTDTDTQTKVVDEFLKEAYRINTHITSLLTYLQSIRQSYLSLNPSQPHTHTHTHPATSQSHPHHSGPPSLRRQSSTTSSPTHLTDTDRDSIDTSTSSLLHNLSSSITNLATAETLRQETQASLFRKRFGHGRVAGALWRWAGGGDRDQDAQGQVQGRGGRSEEQEMLEETERMLKTVRENVLWWLRRGLEGVAEVQRGMVEKRIERVREKEKSVLYKMGVGRGGGEEVMGRGLGAGVGVGGEEATMGGRGDLMDEKEVAEIESKLSPEQLQLFAQENDGLLKHYEDTLGKVQNAEKSLLEISSLQQTLVTHLSTQEDYINQLVTDALGTETNVGQGNKELKRAAERRSTAQAVFWGTVGLCTSLVIWDAIF
ncbi:hypothetical protein FQN50_000016 [Emmonsiellopsis sp. PD_5]|nr:hypothetical protein FQN50_000016 [Emmonsiellopsis sp. PD_5]